jgi:hypothetical protein
MPKSLYPLAADREFVEAAISAGALQRVDGEQYADVLKESGFALLFCGDCDHSQDTIDHLEECFETHRIHHLALNGGALLLDCDSAANKHYDFSESLVRQIRQTFEIKRFIHLYLDVHVPCGVARSYHISAMDAVRSVLIGKQRLIEDPLRPARLKKISPMLRYFDGDRQLTYSFKKATMEPFLDGYSRGNHLQPFTV